MVRENQPVMPVPRTPAPPRSMEWQVGSCDNEREELAHRVGFDTWNDLCRFNWQTTAPLEVNWYLHHHVGCTQPSADDSTYQFSDQSPSQWIYVPQQSRDLGTHPRPGAEARRADPAVAARAVREADTITAIDRSCARIEHYIAAVIKAERIYHGQLSVWSLITALRKTWDGGAYNSLSWRITMPAQYHWADPIDLDRTRGGDRFSDRDRRVLRGIACLFTPQHGCIDFGHVLTGVNARCRPQAAPVLHVMGLNNPARVVAATTWSGDVASVYVGLYPERTNPEATLDRAWDCFASEEDMLADVDGVVLGETVYNDAGSTAFSQLLRQYYGPSPRSQTDIFQEFARLHPPGRAEQMAWPCVRLLARVIGTPPRDHSLWRQVIQRYQGWVRQHRSTARVNPCAETRERLSHPWPPPPPAPARPAPGGVGADAGPPPE